VQGGEVQAAGFILASEVDVVPDPVDIHGGVDAVILEQGYGDGGDSSGFHIGEGALENGEAGDADDGLNLACLDEGHHNGAALAEQAEFIKRRGALALYTQAFRHEQESLFKGYRGQRLAPGFVCQ
jgi:hypothetical protein